MKNKNLSYFVGFVVVLALVIFFAGQWQSSPVKISQVEASAIVNMTSECGCCGVYVSYLSKNIADTQKNSIPSYQLGSIKDKYGIPQSLSSCHTSEIEGYVVEGHVPFEAIEKLLAERPDIAGIALPGMPSGTPGMPGPKTEPWVIYGINKDGSTYEFTRI